MQADIWRLLQLQQIGRLVEQAEDDGDEPEYRRLAALYEEDWEALPEHEKYALHTW